jgi:hypothetical protein
MARIFRPDGEIADPPHTLAPGRQVLTGARIGVLENGKPGAELVMTTVADRLAERVGSPKPLVLHKNAALAAPADVLDELRRSVDLVLTGSAD